MNILSKQAEEEIISAVGDVVDVVEREKCSPTKAVVKISRDRGFQPGFVQLLCHAYNTGSQEAQRNSHKTAFDKFDSFELADAKEALAEIYPNEVKSPAKEAEDSAISGDYDKAPDWLDISRRHKLAHMQLPWTEKAAEDKQPKMTATKAYNAHVKHARLLEDLRLQKSAARLELSRSTGKLGQYFQQDPYRRLPFNVVAKIAAVYHGNIGKTLMDYIRDTYKIKEANEDPVKLSDHVADWDSEPYVYVTECIKHAKEYNEKSAVFDRKTQELQKKSEELLRPFAPKSDQPWTSLIPESRKEASFLSALGGAFIGSGVKDQMSKSLPKPQTTQELVGSTFKDLDDPSHEIEMRKIRAEALLQDLMANDEVISGYDPGEVLEAYNEISAMVPRASTQSAAMRPLLRRYLQGNLQPFEAGEMAKLERGIQQTTTRPSQDQTGQETGNK